VLTFNSASLARVGVLGPEDVTAPPAALGQETPKSQKPKKLTAAQAEFEVRTRQRRQRRRRRTDDEDGEFLPLSLSQEKIAAEIAKAQALLEGVKASLSEVDPEPFEVEDRPNKRLRFPGREKLWKMFSKAFLLMGRAESRSHMAAGLVSFSGDFTPEEMAALNASVDGMYDRGADKRQMLLRDLASYEAVVQYWERELLRVTGQVAVDVAEEEALYARLSKARGLAAASFGPYRRSGWVDRYEADKAKDRNVREQTMADLESQIVTAEDRVNNANQHLEQELDEATKKALSEEIVRLKAKITKLKGELREFHSAEGKDEVKLANPEAETLTEWLAKADPMWAADRRERLARLRDQQLVASGPELAAAYREKILSAADEASLPDKVKQALVKKVEKGMLDPSRQQALSAAIQEAVEGVRAGWERRIRGVNEAIRLTLREVDNFKQVYQSKGGIEPSEAVAILRRILDLLDKPNGIMQTLKEAEAAPAKFLRNAAGAALLVPKLPARVVHFIKDDKSGESIATQIKKLAEWTEEEAPSPRKNNEVRPRPTAAAAPAAPAAPTAPAASYAEAVARQF